MLVSTSPLVSTLTTTMSMDGTMVECLSGPGGATVTAMISIAGSRYVCLKKYWLGGWLGKGRGIYTWVGVIVYCYQV